eukprot:Mrub_03774.p3 GENE.Mrub_03774~~Mrub_03774.p3  ORF type:complete len:133 (-),score=17.89 Mrub_03774:630-1028(-)
MCVAASNTQNESNKLYIMRFKDLHETKFTTKSAMKNRKHTKMPKYALLSEIESTSPKVQVEQLLNKSGCCQLGEYTLYNLRYWRCKNNAEKRSSNYFKNENKPYEFSHKRQSSSWPGMVRTRRKFFATGSAC